MENNNINGISVGLGACLYMCLALPLFFIDNVYIQGFYGFLWSVVGMCTAIYGAVGKGL